MNIMFHQLNVSPHVAPLAESLASLGHRVVFVAYGKFSNERVRLGWRDETLKNCEYYYFSNKLDLERFLRTEAGPFEHICQGLRGNELVAYTQDFLRNQKLGFFVTSETVNLQSHLGLLKKVIYRHRIKKIGNSCKGVLAIGKSAPDFFSSIGCPPKKIYDFAYFVRDQNASAHLDRTSSQGINFLFVGQLVHRKGIDLLLLALRDFQGPYHLDIVGSGERQNELLDLANQLGVKNITYHGSAPIGMVHTFMEKADCLVLPSRFDGWGAVVSESIACGTPVICSSNCGVSGVINQFPGCYIFKSGDSDDLRQKMQLLSAQHRSAKERSGLIALGKCLTAQAGARYLERIIKHSNGDASRPVPPWFIDQKLRH